MKTAAYIFSFIYSFLLLQPLFSSEKRNADLAYCSKDKCPKKEKEESGKKDKCEDKGCNPFMACACGNFFLIQKQSVDFIVLKLTTQKIILLNDNRIVTNLSDCWHPPEVPVEIIIKPNFQSLF